VAGSHPTLQPIRVAPGSRYFETFDHQPFLFVGANDAITWPGLNGLFRRRDLASVERYLHGLADDGVTILRLMIEYAQVDARFFERPAGRFNPAMVRLWDDLFALCEQAGLRVLLAPWDNFWMARRWHRHPYNAIHGGPAAGPWAFFSDPATIDATIRRFQFIVERWGGSGVLAAWDLFNEIDPYWGGTHAQQWEVVTRISDAIRGVEQRAWGFTRPQTVSIFGPAPTPEYEDLIFRHPDLDFATTHIYSAGTIDYPENTVAPAQTMAQWVRHALERCAPNRPYTDSEHGPIHLFNDHKRMLPEPFDDEYERHLMWAHLATGGAGSGMRWPARRPHVLTAGMRRAMLSLRSFLPALDWRHFTPYHAVDDIALSAEGWLVFACRDDRQALIWLLRGDRGAVLPNVLPRDETTTNLGLTLRGLMPGNYRIVCWNTAEGRAASEGCAAVDADRLLRIDLPPFVNDLALAIRPATS
jgi:hypothetical protein